MELNYDKLYQNKFHRHCKAGLMKLKYAFNFLLSGQTAFMGWPLKIFRIIRNHFYFTGAFIFAVFVSNIFGLFLMIDI